MNQFITDAQSKTIYNLQMQYDFVSEPYPKLQSQENSPNTILVTCRHPRFHINNYGFSRWVLGISPEGYVTGRESSKSDTKHK